MFSERVRYIFDYLTSFFSRRFVAKQCGHRTRRKGKISAFGSHCVTKMPIKNHGGVDWCLSCIEEMAIPCAWCGKAIFIGDPITLYRRSEDTLPCAVSYDKDHDFVIGCLTWKCSDLFDRAGFWVPDESGKGYVERTPSPLELAASTGKGVIVQDVGDYREARSPSLVDL